MFQNSALLQQLTSIVTTILKSRPHDDFSRLSIFPVKDPKYFVLYHRSESQRWPETDVNVVTDLPEFDALSDRAQSIVLDIISFFLVGDGVVNEALIRLFMDYIISIANGKAMPLERLNTIMSQMSMETVHQGSYTIAGLTYAKSMDRLEELIRRAKSTPQMRAKIEFSERWTESDTPAWQRLVANSAMEGIGFVAAFAVIFYFRSIDKLKKFVSLNELIAKDEFLHREICVVQALDELGYTCRFEVGPDGIEHVCGIEEEMTPEVEEVIRTIVREAVAVEDAFADHLLSEPLDDFNKEDLKLYIRSIANTLLRMFGLDDEWDVVNPFNWMGAINMEQKTNMFEGTVVAYANSNLKKMLDYKARAGLEKVEVSVAHLTKPEDADF